jgi:hypothetical protein
MDIRVGAVAPVGPPAAKTAAPTSFIEVKVLAVRPARRGGRMPAPDRPDQRRGAGPAQDPPGARVLVVMVLDGTAIPADLATGRYRTFIRVARR